MILDKKWIAFSSLMFIFGFILAFSIASITWLKFTYYFTELPYNQGLMTGAGIFEQEVLRQCPDFNAQKISPEYYAVIIANIEENGSDSINCWLTDTVGGSPSRNDLDCNKYDYWVKKAKELLR